MGSRAVFLRLLLRLVYTNSPCVTTVEGEFIPIFGHAIELEITHLSEENNPRRGAFHRFWPMGLYGSDDNTIECLRENVRAAAPTPSTG